jgi:hypothetical protein
MGAATGFASKADGAGSDIAVFSGARIRPSEQKRRQQFIAKERYSRNEDLAGNSLLVIIRAGCSPSGQHHVTREASP